MKITLELDGLSTLQNLANKYPALSEKYVNLAINRSLLRVLANEKKEAPFGVSGLLRDGWKIDMGRFEGKLYSLSKYALYIEKGTRPHMPPVDELAAWAKKKGINPWALAMSIKKKGTKANPFFQRSIDNSTAGIKTEFNNAIASILHDLGGTL